MASDTRERTKVFVSYSHADDEWLERLRVHLKPLKKSIDLWDDGRIRPGSEWLAEITKALEEARAAIFLVSADFLASDFITNIEVPALLKSARDGGIEILSVIVGPSQFASVEALSKYQTVNDPKAPLIGLSKAKQEEVFVLTASLVELAFSRKPTPPARADEGGAAVGGGGATADCRDYANIFDIHMRRERRNIPLVYAAAVASPLLGISLIVAAWLMFDIKQNPAVVAMLAAFAVAAFVFTYVLMQKAADTQMAIESSRFMKQRFDGCERWEPGELRENIRLALEFLKGGMMRR